MACLSNDQIDRLAGRPDDPANRRPRAHVARCPDCRTRFDQAVQAAGLINDIRELRRRREDVKPMLEELHGRATDRL